MENLFAERIKNAQLTKSQKIIAQFFLNNQDRIGSMSSLDVAKEIGVSDASIIRFARAIGFEGYADLKNQLYHQLVENAYGTLSLSERFSRNLERFSGDLTPDHFRELTHTNLESVFRNNSPEAFARISSEIVASKKRYIVGMRGCKGQAVKFGRLLSFMLPEVRTIIDGECTSILNVQDISQEDVLVMFVFSRFYKIDLDYVKLAKARGAKVFLIVNELTGPLNPYADEILMVSSTNMSFFHSTLAVDMAGEFLLNMISQKVDFRERMDERDQITSNLRL